MKKEKKRQISEALKGRKRPKKEIEKADISCRKCNDKTEMEMMDLFNYGFRLKQIAEIYDVKKTTIDSIRRRYLNGKRQKN